MSKTSTYKNLGGLNAFSKNQSQLSSPKISKFREFSPEFQLSKDLRESASNSNVKSTIDVDMRLEEISSSIANLKNKYSTRTNTKLLIVY